MARFRLPRAVKGEVIPTFAVCAVTVALAVVLGALAPWPWVVVLLAAFAWMAMPGVVLSCVLCRGDRGAFGTASLFGPAAGTALSSLALLGLWWPGGRHWGILVVAPLLALTPALVAGRWPAVLRPITVGRRDLVAACALLALVLLLVGRPFARVGSPVDGGEAYRAYFTADFVWKMAVVAEVAKGDVPPRNQFLAGEPLRYYWLPHLISAVEYRALAGVLRLESLLLVNAVLFGLAFMLFLYGLSRQFVPSPAWAAAGAAAAILCGSFEGVERLLAAWSSGAGVESLRYVNIDAATRWFYGSLPIDGLQRLLWYQPQHHAMAYAVGTTAFVVLWQAHRPAHPLVMLLTGACLGASLLLSAFSGLMITMAVAPIALFVLVRARATPADLITSCALCVIPIALAAHVALSLAYVEDSAGLIELGLHHMAVTRVWPALLLNFGLALPAVIGGLLVMRARRDQAAVPFAVFTAMCLAFYFFVNVRDVQDVYVGWRAGHLFFIVSAPLTGYLLHAWWTAGGCAGRAGVAAVFLLALAALPTVAIDWFNTQDIDNRARGPGFPWTLVIGDDERAALDWIRRETPPDALVQVSPRARDPETWSYIPTFAERRMAAGLPISMVPLDPYRRATEYVDSVFAAGDPHTLVERAARAGIRYLVIGAPERHHHPDIEPVIEQAPALLRQVFRSGSVAVYEVCGGGGFARPC